MFFSFNLYSGLLLPFFLQGIIVAAVLWARRRREDTAADGWLALLLLLFAVRLAQWMLGFAGWYDSHDARTTFMFYWPFSNWLAVGPTLYFYFRSLTNQEFRLQRRHWWHFAPALAVLAWRGAVVGYDIGWWQGLQSQHLPEHFGTKGPLAAWVDYQPIGLLLDVLGYGSVLLYAVRSLREYRAYARYLNDNFSDTEQIRFRWLRNVLVAVVLGTSVTLAFGLINTFISPLNYVQNWYDYLFTGLLIYYLSIAGLLTGYRLVALRFQPLAATTVALASIMPPTEETLSTAEALPGSEGVAVETTVFHPAPAQPDTPELAALPAATAPLVADVPVADVAADAELTRWTGRLLAHMQSARPYLEPELTLSELAGQLRTNTSWLSRVINTGCGQNFNDFINEYRVCEAENRLRDPQFRHYTLLAVALEAGFNSKSTFNRVFKKLRGQTPSEVARQV
ncbi:helix-turn-helix domain-containing protein [Hymenobacter puniceus]|uniref:helix-turn-helix domain-containing protein n=1 Tax=Hymenobacter sp. BT190 TaxID=2763505 RepID=UPI0016514690|nr:helix-turn-helix transcriptional regulator [Hymenobacter sp. BT190]MBC6699048.1 helix-turn-helix transcriptional regulator [Hymenobacter sp. BT190]